MTTFLLLTFYALHTQHTERVPFDSSMGCMVAAEPMAARYMGEHPQYTRFAFACVTGFREGAA